MRLDRNSTPEKRGKYALIHLRKLDQFVPAEQATELVAALKVLEDAGLVEFGETGAVDEFFVIKLRDENARAALNAYVECVHEQGEDEEYAADVFELAERSGPAHPQCKKPD